MTFSKSNHVVNGSMRLDAYGGRSSTTISDVNELRDFKRVWTETLMGDTHISPLVRIVGFWVCHYIHIEQPNLRGYAWASVTTLAQHFGCKRPTASKAITTLEQSGYINRKIGRGKNSTNLYSLRFPSVCQSEHPSDISSTEYDDIFDAETRSEPVRSQDADIRNDEQRVSSDSNTILGTDSIDGYSDFCVSKVRISNDSIEMPVPLDDSCNSEGTNNNHSCVLNERLSSDAAYASDKDGLQLNGEDFLYHSFEPDEAEYERYLDEYYELAAEDDGVPETVLAAFDVGTLDRAERVDRQASEFAYPGNDFKQEREAWLSGWDTKDAELQTADYVLEAEHRRDMEFAKALELEMSES